MQCVPNGVKNLWTQQRPKAFHIILICLMFSHANHPYYCIDPIDEFTHGSLKVVCIIEAC